MSNPELEYALAKQVPDLARRAVFETNYGRFELDPEDSRKVSALVEQLLLAKLGRAAHNSAGSPHEPSGEPAAWLHAMHFEPGNGSQTHLSFTQVNPFGTPGVDYSAGYRVTSEPLYRHAQPPCAWQPIETAPKKGEFMVWISDTDLAWPAYAGGDRIYSNAHGLLNERQDGRVLKATHWMPLPPDPTALTKTAVRDPYATVYQEGVDHFNAKK